MTDDFGNEIKLGDRVMVSHRDASIGAHLWLCQGRFEVVGFGRTRVRLAGSYLNSEVRVGPSALRIVEPVDGRTLRTADQVWAERVR